MRDHQTVPRWCNRQARAPTIRQKHAVPRKQYRQHTGFLGIRSLFQVLGPSGIQRTKLPDDRGCKGINSRPPTLRSDGSARELLHAAWTLSRTWARTSRPTGMIGPPPTWAASISGRWAADARRHEPGASEFRPTVSPSRGRASIEYEIMYCWRFTRHHRPQDRPEVQAVAGAGRCPRRGEVLGIRPAAMKASPP